jgi:FkbM family methyltransferase
MMHYAGDDAIVYAFEPTPRMIDILEEKSKGVANYRIVKKAVADYNGKSTFFISGNQDWGCSSLNTFNDNLDHTWPGRTDFKVTDQIEVDVIRLDGFIEEHGIQEIEFFHCDTQGKDMEVLMGMGIHLRKIKRGVIEMATKHDTKLYKDQKYLVEDAVGFLNDNGFGIDAIVPNDCFCNEVNIEFSRV